MMRNISISHTIRRWPIEIFPKPMISCRAVRCGRDEGICLRQDGSRSSPSQPSNGEKIVDVRRVASLRVWELVCCYLSITSGGFFHAYGLDQLLHSRSTRLLPGICPCKSTIQGTVSAVDGHHCLHLISAPRFI